MAAAPLNKRLGIDFTYTSTVQKHELGVEVDANDGRRYKYIRAGSAIAVGDVLVVDTAEGPNDFMQSTAAADLVIAGVAHVVIADNDYGWVVVAGVVSAKAALTVVPGAPIVTIATAGTVDDTLATAANAIAAGAGRGGIFASTTSGGLASVILM